MRKLFVAFCVFTLVIGGASAMAYDAEECAKGNLADQFGDWFGTLGKRAKAKTRILSMRRSHRLAACSEKQAQEAAQASPKSGL